MNKPHKKTKVNQMQKEVKQSSLNGCQTLVKKLRNENTILKEELHVLNDKKLVKELLQSIQRIEKGKFISEKEFFKGL